MTQIEIYNTRPVNPSFHSCYISGLKTSQSRETAPLVWWHIFGSCPQMPITFQRVSFQDKFCQINVVLVTTFLTHQPADVQLEDSGSAILCCAIFPLHFFIRLHHPMAKWYVCCLTGRASPTSTSCSGWCVMTYLRGEANNVAISACRVSGRETILVGSGTQNSRSQSQVQHWKLLKADISLWLLSVVHSLDLQSVVQGLIRRPTCNWVTMTTMDFNIEYSLPAWHLDVWVTEHDAMVTSVNLNPKVLQALW